jgi:hypothetical protein
MRVSVEAGSVGVHKILKIQYIIHHPNPSQIFAHQDNLL